jgi:hypothetical protein
MDDLLDAIVSESVDNKPEPSSFAEGIIQEQQHDENDKSNGEAVTAQRSPTGTPSGFASSRLEEIFDPAVHAVGPDGQPRRNKDGSYRRRKGRGVGVVPAGQPQQPTGPTPGCREAAKVTVSTITILGQVTFGEEWQAMPQEIEMMVAAWTDYFMSQGVDSFPPWVGVAMATGAYALPRCGRPKTKDKLSRFWDWCKSKLWRTK